MKIFVELWKKDKKKASSIVLTVVFVLFIVIGATYAFFMADTGDGATAGVRVVTKMSDSLMFEVGEDIFIDVNEQTLALNGTNISDSTYARATLRGNGDVKAQATYNVYLQIDTNSLEYTSNDQKPELLLQVTDPTGRAFGQSDLPNLAYVTAGTEANQVSGFDITTTSGLIKLANNYLIEVLNGQKMDEWTITMTFMNLDTDQFANTNKVLDARILIQKEEYTNPDIYIATTYDGSPIVPSTFGATAEIDCFGNDASYNYRYNRLIIGAINQESAACNLKFTTPSYKDYLNQKVIGLAGGGQVFNEDGYRYEGTNPDNYIWFNNELWRIIGVFGSGMHGEDANLVKIIRARSLGGYAFDKDGDNDWGTSSLKSLLNGPYLQSENGNNSDNCYLYSNTVKGYCDYTRIGIGSTYRGMIQETTWYIGAVSSQITSSSGDTHVAEYKMTAGEYYEAERKNGVATVRDYIGLMYPSDYGYSVLSSSCGRTMQVSSYNKNVCGGKSWIYGAGVEWTLMRDSYSTDGIYRISIEGYLSPNSASMGREVRPVLYLKPSVYVIEGNGKANNPYVIGM